MRKDLFSTILQSISWKHPTIFLGLALPCRFSCNYFLLKIVWRLYIKKKEKRQNRICFQTYDLKLKWKDYFDKVQTKRKSAKDEIGFFFAKITNNRFNIIQSTCWMAIALFFVFLFSCNPLFCTSSKVKPKVWKFFFGQKATLLFQKLACHRNMEVTEFKL